MTKTGGRPAAAKPPFSQVVAHHGPTVLRVCRAVVGTADADDAWSETSLSALRAYPELPAEANMEAWLVTIAHRKAIDIVRKAKRAPEPLADLPDTVPGAVGAGSVGASGVAGAGGVDGAVDRMELAHVLGALTERQRLAITYHYLGGLAYREVAEALGGSPDSARRAAADGIAKLRRTGVLRPDDDE